MESQPDELAPEGASRTFAELKKLKSHVDRMVAHLQGGQPVTGKAVRLLDGLVLEVMKQQILNAPERGIELLDRARTALESVSPAEIAEILKAETSAKRNAFTKKLRAVSGLASTLSEAASPSAFNPLDYKVLGRSIASALDSSETHTMPPTSKFPGVGVYALYYVGSFPPYWPLAEKNIPAPKVPIYIGKAVPEGSRIGGAASAKSALCDRLLLHAKSISEASVTLRLEDFRYRFLIVEPAFVPLGEVVLLKEYKPLWNTWLYGFGSNPAGGGRGKTQRSLWDTLHPGRARAAGFKDAWNPEELKRQVEGHLRGEKVDHRLLRLAKEAEATDTSADEPDSEEAS
jgi:hypothetical protein